MYLGPIGKPFHKQECQCEDCCQWMVDEIEQLQAKVTSLEHSAATQRRLLLESAFRNGESAMPSLVATHLKHAAEGAVFDVDQFCQQVGKLSDAACAKIREATEKGVNDG